MAWFIPAIMAIGHGAAAAGAGAAGSAGAAGAGAAAGAAGVAGAGAGAAGAAGAGTAAGAGLAGAGAGSAGAGAAGGAAAMPAAGSVAAKAPSLMDKSDAFLDRPTVMAGRQTLGSLTMGAGKSSAVPNAEPGPSVQNPIVPSPSFLGGDSAMPQALMPGAMDMPFGAPGRRALSDSLSRNGG